MSKKKKDYQNGKVSFTIEELEQHAKSGDNTLAWELLWKASTTSGHVKDKEAENGRIEDFDDIYPISPEECDEMQSYLDQAIVASNGGAGDPELSSRIDELQDIINWSKKRHWNFQWLLIAGCFITLCFIWYSHNDAQETTTRRQHELEQVKAWAKVDTTLTWEQVPYMDVVPYEWRSEGTAKYKAWLLCTAKHNYEKAIEYEKQYKAKLDTASTDRLKEIFTKDIKRNQEDQKRYKAEFEEYAKMDAETIHKDAIERFEGSLERSQSGEGAILRWLLFFVILIPLYIFAERPYGWMESRHRTEKKVLGWIQKIGIGMASFFFGTGLMMSLLPDYIVETHYSGGRVEKHRESDPVNVAILALKVGLMILGVIIFCSISVLLTVYATFVGLKRNYEWSTIFAAAKNKVQTKKAA